MPAPASQRERAERGRQFVQLLSEGEYDRAAAQFDATMASALPVPQLASLWEQLCAAHGPLQSLGEPTVQPVQGYQAVWVPAQFQRAALTVRVVFDAGGAVAGLFVQPAWEPPPYADPSAFSEREVSIGAIMPLPATLTIPVGRQGVPAVVLVHGSGPNDRDETVLARKPFKDLAWGLASRGIAVLRYDKRTRAHPEQMLALGAELTVEQEVIDDALLAVALVRQQPEVRAECVFVLGHSLGGTVAPRIAARDPELAGLIVLAGSTRPLEDLVLDQVQYLAQLEGDSAASAARLKAVRAQVARVKALQEGDEGAEALLLGLSARYWLDLRAHDPTELARNLDRPMLVLQGGRDYQVTREDFERWKTVLGSRSDVQCKLYPSLDHLFGEGQGPSRPEDYARPVPVAEIVIADIAAWIQERCPSP